MPPRWLQALGGLSALLLCLLTLLATKSAPVPVLVGGGSCSKIQGAGDVAVPSGPGHPGRVNPGSCIQNVMSGWSGRIRRIPPHSSRILLLKRPGEPRVKAIVKELRHSNEQSLEYEMLATSVDALLALHVRPKAKGFLAMRPKRPEGLLKWLAWVWPSLDKHDVLSSIASGQGVNVVSVACAECNCVWKKAKGWDMVQINVLEFLEGLSNPKQQQYSLLTANFSDKALASDSPFLQSAAYTHLLNNILGSFDQKNRKNCFVDQSGKMWAIDFDISSLGSSRRFSQIAANTEQCVRTFWGSHVLGLDDLHCAMISAMQTKLSVFMGDQFRQFGHELYAMLRSQHFWDLTSCPVRANSQQACLQRMHVPSFFWLYATHTDFPWSAVVLHPQAQGSGRSRGATDGAIGDGSDAESRQPACSVDLPLIWSFILRARLLNTTAMLQIEYDECRLKAPLSL